MKSKVNLLYPVVETGKVSYVDHKRRYPMLLLKKVIRSLFPHLYGKISLGWYRIEFYPVPMEGLLRVRKLARENTPYFILTFHDDHEKE